MSKWRTTGRAAWDEDGHAEYGVTNGNQEVCASDLEELGELLAGWISVDDRLPDMGQVVALRDENTYMNAPDAQGGGDEGGGRSLAWVRLPVGDWPQILDGIRRARGYYAGFYHPLVAATHQLKSPLPARTGAGRIDPRRNRSGERLCHFLTPSKNWQCCCVMGSYH